MVARLMDAEIETLRAANGGEVAACETALGTAVFRAPTPEEYLKSLAMQAREREAIHAPRWLACACVVSPDRPTFEAWIAKRPAIPKAVDRAIMLLAGLDTSAPYEDAEDGETTTVETPLGRATFKIPDERQFNEYRRRIGSSVHDACAYLALCCVVDPTREALTEWLSRKPGIASTVMPAIQRLAGIEAETRAKP